MIWLTADLHLGHKNILKHEAEARPFATIEEHDAQLLSNWAEVVAPDDHVIVLGDLCLGSVRKYAERLAALPGTKHLIAGNHDAIFNKGIMHVPSVQALLHAGFEYISAPTSGGHPHIDSSVLGWPAGYQVSLSHFPTEGESAERPERFAGARPVGAALVLCGHVHSAWLSKGININVGVDVRGLYPVAAESLWPEAEAILANQLTGAQ